MKKPKTYKDVIEMMTDQLASAHAEIDALRAKVKRLQQASRPVLKGKSKRYKVVLGEMGTLEIEDSKTGNTFWGDSEEMVNKLLAELNRLDNEEHPLMKEARASAALAAKRAR